MGRLALRAGWDRPDLEFVHVNELNGDAATCAHLLEFDSVHGRWPHADRGRGRHARDRRSAAHDLAGGEPGRVAWGEPASTSCSSARAGSARRETLAPYLEQGVAKVVVAAPVKHGRAQRRDGRERRPLRPWRRTTSSRPPPARRTASRRSCKVLHEALGIRHGSITTLHDMTNTQTIVDAPHKDLRRARAASLSLIPTTTGSATRDRADLPRARGTPQRSRRARAAAERVAHRLRVRGRARRRRSRRSTGSCARRPTGRSPASSATRSGRSSRSTTRTIRARRSSTRSRRWSSAGRR